MPIADKFAKSLLTEGIQHALVTPLQGEQRENVVLQNVASQRPDDIGEMMMKYEEVDNETQEPTGRSVSLVGVEFQPLQYSDLVGQKLSGKVVILLSWRNARVHESSISEIPTDRNVSGNAVLNSNFSSTTIGLVNGGWLPSGLALQGDMIVMPDRCTVSELAGRFRAGARKGAGNEDFLDLFADKPVRINPLLYALEGNVRRNPPPDVVEQQLDEACAKVQSALPMARLAPDRNGWLKGALGLIQDSQAGMACKQDFLIRIAPRLHAPVSAKRLSLLWNEVLAAADSCNVPRLSLVVLAALSAIAVPNGRSPAKALLKLTQPNYSKELAYNALADLRSLEILMSMLGAFPNQRLLLCTGDRDLALFWVGIRANNLAWRNEQLHFKLSPVEELLPGMTQDWLASSLGADAADDG